MESISTMTSKPDEMEKPVDEQAQPEYLQDQSSRKVLRSQIRIWAALILIVSLCLCAWGFVRAGDSQSSEDSISRLSLAVSRLMLADEVSVNDEAQRASDSLEQVLTERDLVDPRMEPKAVDELFKIAGSIRDQLSKSDRKSAIESLVLFKSKAAALEADFYKLHSKSSPITISFFLLIGLTGILVGFALLWWHIESVDNKGQALEVESSTLREELENFKFRFEEEQRRNIDLQQRLIEIGKGSKKMESGIEEYSRAVNQLESAVKYLKSSLGEAESKVNTLEKEIGDLSQTIQDRDLKISSLHAIIEAGERSEAALQSKIQTLIAEKDEQYENLSAQIKVLSHNENSSDDGVPPLGSEEVDVAPGRSLYVISSSSELPPDLAKLQSELIQEKTRIQSELAVFEWSNTKLKNELDEVKEELSSAKAALAAQEREARERLLSLEEKFAAEKRQVMNDLSSQFEAEAKFLRDQLRAANERSLEKTG